MFIVDCNYWMLASLKDTSLVSFCLNTNMARYWRRKWQPTPVFLPREFHGQRSRWATIYGVTQSRTWLKWLSSSSIARYKIFASLSFPKSITFFHCLLNISGHWMFPERNLKTVVFSPFLNVFLVFWCPQLSPFLWSPVPISEFVSMSLNFLPSLRRT